MKPQDISKIIKVLSNEKLNRNHVDELFDVMIKQQISTKTLASIIGITDRRIRQLVDSNILPNNIHGEHNLINSVKAYIDYLRSLSSTSSEPNLSLERAAKTRVEKEIKELELRSMHGELIETETAMDAWSKCIQQARSKILSIPTKAAPLVVGTKNAGEAQDILQRVVNEALKELANPSLVDISIGIQNEKQKQKQKRRIS